MSPRISIITVVYNGEKVLQRTIESILNQSFRDIEYIIIDGNSKDGTKAIIEKYETVISQWSSEPDKGLYDAMNKGLRIAHGEYVLFLNAGDQFYEKTTLARIFEIQANADIYYGETMMVDEADKEIGLRRLKAPEVLTRESLINGMLVCHQSFIIRRAIALEYDLKLRIAADYNWMLECLKRSRSIVNTHLIISRFLEGGMGLNTGNIIIALRERFGIMVRNYGFLRTTAMHLLIGLRFSWFVIRKRRF
jgi:glycosyltransferase involved in cell wall biosynthesis